MQYNNGKYLTPWLFIRHMLFLQGILREGWTGCLSFNTYKFPIPDRCEILTQNTKLE